MINQTTNTLPYTRCNICGHSSHCGTPLYKEFKDVVNNQVGTIKVCNSCSCNECVKIK